MSAAGGEEEGGMVMARASLAFMDSAAVEGDGDGDKDEDEGEGWILESRWRIMCWNETVAGRTGSVGQRRRMRCQCL